jgi:hypothetical protein
MKLYQISWTQVYENWPKANSCQAEILDLAEARAVLARIMSL